MDQHAAFIQAIIDNREDDAPRLIYADQLEEWGEGARAEFIRVQVALAKWDWGPYWTEADHRAMKCECSGCGLRNLERELPDKNMPRDASDPIFFLWAYSRFENKSRYDGNTG